MRRIKFKKEKNEAVNIKSLLPGYGFAPYKRALIGATIMLLISFIMSFLAIKDILFMPPIEIAKTENAVKWILLEIFMPYTLLYFSSLFVGLAILSMQDFQYIRWLTKQAISPIMVNYFLMLLIIVTLGAINVYSNIYIPQLQDSELNPMEKSLWMTVLILYVVPIWMGYKTAWKSYRELGAKTMQDRYEEKLGQLEVKNSGQFWDKYVTRTFNRVLGLDGVKPRGGFTFFFFNIIFLMVLYGIAESIGVFFYATAVYFIVPTIAFMMMATAKYKDVKKTNREPYLITVRYQDTVDSLDRASKGVQRFSRY